MCASGGPHGILDKGRALCQSPADFSVKRKWLWLLPLLLVVDALLLYWWFNQQREHSQDGVILQAARRYGVDPALVKAVVWRESRFEAKAKGRAGEIGLMQVGEAAAREWAEAERIRIFFHRELFDPGKNTLAGAWYLRKLLRRYAPTDNPLPYALADYNAGRSNVLRWNRGAAQTNSALFIEQIDFPGTKQYVQAVLRRFEQYRPVFPPGAKDGRKE